MVALEPPSCPAACHGSPQNCEAKAGPLPPTVYSLLFHVSKTIGEMPDLLHCLKPDML